MQISIVSDKQVIKIEAQYGETLLSVIRRAGVSVSADCGGFGVCGKCKVRLLQGRVENEVALGGFVRACKATVCEDLTISADAAEASFFGGVGVFAATDKEDGFGVALDLGTTTLAAELIDLNSGKVLDRASLLNSQAAFGADVLTRISAANSGQFDLLTQAIINQISQILLQFKQKNGIEKIKRLVVAANTTMTHILCGVSPKTIGEYPYKPVFCDMVVNPKNLEKLGVEVVVLPCIGAYVGGDIVAGILSSGLDEADGELLVDLGTNGEIALSANGKIYCTSAAAGPAFEGASIECGIGGVEGAIDSVKVEDGKLIFSTIGGKPAKGICGAGLTDLIAELLRLGIITSDGAFAEDYYGALNENLIGDKFFLTKEVYLSQKDIRQFQLAKSAVFSAVESLLKFAKVDSGGLKSVYLAGGVGYYINTQNAVETGVLPRWFLNVIRVVGNSSLDGAKLVLTSKAARERAVRIQKNSQVVDLNLDSDFSQTFLDNIGF